MSLGRFLLLSGFGLTLVGCLFKGTPETPRTARDSAGGGGGGASRGAVRDSMLDQRVARLELRVAERDAELEELQARLDEARQEVVRTMAKLQTVASRAEAASAMAEAEIALQSLRAMGSAEPGSGVDVAQASLLLQQASVEFAQRNYGGALYLANQAKSVAGIGRNRLGTADRPPLRPGEVAFAVPVKLQATTRGNVREGPGSGFKVLFAVEPGAGLVGYSYVEQWVRIADASGRGGWMFLNLVRRRERDAGDR